MIAGIAALRLRICLGLALKIRARHVVEQHLILNGKQLAAALRQMRFEFGLMHEQTIEPAIQPILVDLLVTELEQIRERCASIPVLSNMQLARWFAKPRGDQHRRHLRPRDALLADRKQPLAQSLKPGSAPQGERQVHVAELTRALDANALQPHRHRQLLAVIIKQLRLLGIANQPARQRPRLNATVLVEFAKMRHRLLDDPTPDTNAAHQAPVAVNLPVLLANRVAQVHAPSKPPPQRKKIPEVVTTRSNHPPKPSKPLIRLAPCRAKSQKPSPNCASWARRGRLHRKAIQPQGIACPCPCRVAAGGNRGGGAGAPSRAERGGRSRAGAML